jgi:ankyrin repeat protein
LRKDGGAFVRAVASAHQPLINLFLTAGINVNAVGEQGRTPLLVATLGRDWALARRLLAAGADPRLPDDKGLTPLMATSIAGHVPMLEALLAAGASREAIDDQRHTALYYAIAHQQTAARDALLECPQPLPPAAQGGNELADAALATGDRQFTELILRLLPGGLTWTPAARTAFAKALAARDTIFGPLLLAKYAAPPATADNMQPMLAYAVARGDLDQVNALLDFGANPNTTLDQSSDTAFRDAISSSALRFYLGRAPGLNVLMLAASLKKAACVKLLLEKGADRRIGTSGKMQLLPLYFAAWADSPETIQILLGKSPRPEDIRIEISLDNQRVIFFRDGKVVLSSIISTGREGFGTKPGEYVITDKDLHHHSTLYQNASMPYFMRLSCAAFGLHEGYVTGRPASHGCIRLPGEVARRLYAEAPIGTWVSIKR